MAERRHLHIKYRSVAALAAVCALLVVALSAGAFALLFWKGNQALTAAWILGTPQSSNMEGGILPAILGTVASVLLMSACAIPVGVLSALYLVEYSSPTSLFAHIFRVSISTLAGVPPVVIGLFGLAFFIRTVGQNFDAAVGNTSFFLGRPSMLWAALTLAILTLPTVILAVESTLRAVPQSWRESSLALGATQWETIWRIVLPNALGGISTAAILGMARAAGEVVPLLFVGVIYSQSELWNGFTGEFMHLGYHLYVLTTQAPNPAEAVPLQYATALLLLVVSAALNIAAQLLNRRLQKSIAQNTPGV